MDWINVIASAGAGTVLLSLGVFVFNESIRQWLTRSVSADLERLKSDLAREVEAYKVTLIAETERAKANQQIKTALALRIGEKRFEAIADLNAMVIGLAPPVGAIGTTVYDPPFTDIHEKVFRDQWAEAAKLVNDFGKAIDLAQPFISTDKLRDLLELRGHAFAVLRARDSIRVGPISENDPRVHSLLATSGRVQTWAAAELAAFDLR